MTSRSPGSSFEYFPHGADIGVIGRGATPEEAFVRAAEATFAISSGPGAIAETVNFPVAFDEDDLEFALVDWLNQLITEARIRGLSLVRFALRRDGGHWHGWAWGGPWTGQREKGVEVKGATLTGLEVRETDDTWEARCVVDV